MGVSSGPEIINGDLVLYYDASNTDKSWRGKPTTNLVNVVLSAVQMIGVDYVGLEDGWKKYSLNGTWTAGTYPYAIAINGPTFTGGVSYSSACYLKTNVIHKFNYFGTGMNYVNQPMNKGGAPFGVLQPDGSYYCGRSDFEYTSSTPQAGYILSNPIANVVFSSTTDFVWIKNGQVEQGSFPTPFAGDAGTRSNTQALLDLTGRNTLTANSLTYASNNTFRFDGTNNFITAGPDTNIISGNQITVEAWVRTNVTGVYKKIFTNGSAVGVYLSIGPSPFNTYFGVVTSGTSGSASTTTDLSTTSYSHLVGTYNGTTVALYINGTLVSSAAASGTISTGATTYISGYPSGGERWDGAIDAIKVYNRALSASEVTQNFVAMRGRYGI